MTPTSSSRQQPVVLHEVCLTHPALAPVCTMLIAWSPQLSADLYDGNRGHRGNLREGKKKCLQENQEEFNYSPYSPAKHKELDSHHILSGRWWGKKRRQQSVCPLACPGGHGEPALLQVILWGEQERSQLMWLLTICLQIPLRGRARTVKLLLSVSGET